ncbi:ornithine decarboxylase-like [Bombina bombina]|uniref:ornithine decarboxylase-like n=1 Tax=Bombina bombina TaxID=8345 RepID=UPI00235A6D2A|nr:ornithine decarboxylase-like [Bombina bombina]
MTMALTMEKLTTNYNETIKNGFCKDRSNLHIYSKLNGMRELNVTVLDSGITAKQFLKQKITRESLSGEKNAFFVADLGVVVHQHWRFLQKMPRVKPFYAVKCNSTKEVLQILALLGCGFDCASKLEIDTILDMGVPAANIVYANPCKQPSHIRHAARRGVCRMTFDCESELVKVAENHPEAEMILRIKADDSESLCCLSKKFGASVQSCEDLLEAAKRLNVNVIGVSFHVGTGNKNPHAFDKTISDARKVIDIGRKLGFKMRLLDIGGGLPGRPDFEPAFEQFAEVIMESLDHYFPCDEGFEIIAEPGRYYVASAFTEAINIITKKELKGVNEKDRRRFAYHLNDGVFGSFLEKYLMPVKLTPIPEKDIDRAQPFFSSILWGPCCAETDEVMNEVDLPELEVEDWLIFQNIGAYSICFSTHFNGFIPPPVYAVITKDLWQLLEHQRLRESFSLLLTNRITC